MGYSEAEKSRRAQVSTRSKLAEECGISGPLNARIHITNVFPGLSDATLKGIFDPVGRIIGASLPRERELPKGYAFVQ